MIARWMAQKSNSWYNERKRVNMPAWLTNGELDHVPILHMNIMIDFEKFYIQFGGNGFDAG